MEIVLAFAVGLPPLVGTRECELLLIGTTHWCACGRFNFRSRPNRPVFANFANSSSPC